MENIKRIKFIEPPEHINKYLTHWTGRGKNDQLAFEILSIIINTRKLKFSSNQIFIDNSGTTVNQAMISFTDTPIPLSIQHCKTYGYFAVSFNKQKLIEYGVNPVLYLVDNRKQHQSFLQNFHLIKNDVKNLFGWITAMIQPYNTNPENLDHYPEFYEREWRLSRILPFHWIKEAEKNQGLINEYPFKGEIDREQIGNDINKEVFFILFESDLIENIIVPVAYEKQAIELIENNNLDIELIVVEKANPTTR